MRKNLKILAFGICENDKVFKRYSEPFKLKILDEPTTGKPNKNQLGKRYRNYFHYH